MYYISKVTETQLRELEAVARSLALAIFRRRNLRFCYGGHPRAGSPHAVGVVAGHAMCLLLQTRPTLGWRLFQVQLMSDIVQIETRVWYTSFDYGLGPFEFVLAAIPTTARRNSR